MQFSMSIWKVKWALRWTSAATFSAFLLASSWEVAHARQEGKMESLDRGRCEGMFALLHEALKKNYYDPTFHGVDMDARYKVYAERVKTSQTLAEAFRNIAAYLAVLDDSHTIFMPPHYAFRFDYGYRMQMVGDQCLIIGTRPGSEAADKLRAGDQVLSLDGYAVNRKDFWQLEYYLSALAPKPTSNFVLRDPSGTDRREVVNTAYSRVQRVTHMFPEEGQMEYEKWQHQMKSRFAELGDAMVWKMPGFFFDEGEIDGVVSRARKHQVLLLDLRGNGGGFDVTLRYLVGSLFDHEVHVGTRITRKGEKPMDVRPRDKGVFTGKLLVLVDSRSASAAEVFTRLVQLEHRGTVVGDRSAGSVMEADFYPFQWGLGLPIHFAAEITMADLMMADGKRLEKVGVTPDVLVLPAPADLAAGRDPVLARAAEIAGVELDPVVAGKMFPIEWVPN